MKLPRPLTAREMKAHLRLGAVNAVELDRVFRGYAPRERPPGLLEAIAGVKRARAAASSKKKRVR